MLLAIFTYNRLDYLNKLLDSLQYSICNEVIIFNDSLEKIDTKYNVIYSDRKGIHYAKNLALNYFYNSNHSVLFMCEDDIYFVSKGWESLYISDSRDMISYYCDTWDNRKHDGRPFSSQGAFTKVTKNVIDTIGYFDMSMGFRGIGHLDYALRYCRAFKQIDYFDVNYSNNYIKMILEDYRHSLPEEDIIFHRKNQASKIKIAKERIDNFILFSH